MKTKKDVVHIYHGTQGAAGLYLHEIYSALSTADIKQEAFLSYYFTFNYGKKVFFKYTDLASGLRKSRFRIYLRAIELLIGLTKTYVYILFNRPKIVNYSLITSFTIDYIFLKVIKITTNSKIAITCHDVIPFGENKESVKNQTKQRLKILDCADFLIVHNQNSIVDLNLTFNIKSDKVYYHPFPLMDLNKINVKKGVTTNKEYDFSFIGHLRNNKGVDVLLKAWKLFHVRFPEATLLIAGNLPDGSNLELHGLEQFNVTVKIGFLTNEDYYDYLNKTRNVVLPYRFGTNSGVLYNLITMEVNIIFSDLLMFTSSPLLNISGKFLTEDVDSLVLKLEEFYLKKDIILENNSVEYMKIFNEKIKYVYKEMLNIN